ncbi:MAG: RNA-directed DNA polymerase, partial [Sphingobacteriaceae bacterium]
MSRQPGQLVHPQLFRLQIILSSLLSSVKEDSSLEFSGTKDKALLSVLKLLFQISSKSIRTEIRFHDFSGLQHAINEILKIKGWSCFEFIVGSVCRLDIKVKDDFVKLIEIDELKKECLYIKTSTRITHNEHSLAVTKILECLITRHHEINLLISTRTLNCKTDHTALILFKEYYVLKANKIDLKEKHRLPFTYRISHKENDYRELSIPHPKNQLEVIAFYDDYKELILYYSRKSSFTIRKPEKVASYVFVNDDLHKKKKGDQLDFIEESGKEYDTLKTFFTYKRYPNIHKFYEDYKYHRAEKKYNFMYKFDIAKCFDSIYTHSISWALYDKNLIKDNLSASKKTFPGRFDSLMQNANFGETNGILIGPEFSRIFSELILQRIDKDVEDKLSSVHGLHLKKDYEVYRYVDDYFVFYNDEVAKVHIMDSFKVLLKEYKMSISDAKSKLYLKPLITGLTIAKSKIIDLFEKEIKFKIKSENENEILQTLDYRCNSNNLITKFKIIITEAEVDYKDIMNFTLALIHKRVEKCISDFELYYHSILRYEFKNTLDEEKYPLRKDQYTRRLKQENVYTNHLLELLDFTFFIYTVNPRVNFTIRLCHILSNLITSYSKMVKFFTGKYSDPTR